MSDCRSCQIYKKLGDICPIEHNKAYYWDNCRKYKPVNPSTKTVKKIRKVRAR